MADVDVVRRFRAAYEAQDAATARALMTDDFRFTSPQDDHLDAAEWLEKCFPTVDHFAESTPLQLLDGGEVVLMRYEYVLNDGSRYRNVEATTVRDGKIAEVEVYFGGAI